MQTLPRQAHNLSVARNSLTYRLLFSLITVSCYIPLLFFLRRPDPGAMYLSPRPTSALSLSPSTDTLPPWERLSFPNFSIIEKGTYSFSPKLDTFEEEPTNDDLSAQDTPTPSKRFSFPLRPRSSTLRSMPVGSARAYPSALKSLADVKAGLKAQAQIPPLERKAPHDHGEAGSERRDSETEATSFELHSEIREPLRTGLPTPEAATRAPPAPYVPPRPPTMPPPLVSAQKTKPSLVVDTRNKSNRARFEEGIPSPLSPIAPSILSCGGPVVAGSAPLSSGGRQRSNTIPASLELEVSFSMMLSYIPPAPLPTSISAPLMSGGWSSHSRSSSASTIAPPREGDWRSRSGTPDVRDSGGGGGRSMASEVNRRTLKFLIWFPVAVSRRFPPSILNP